MMRNFVRLYAGRFCMKRGPQTLTINKYATTRKKVGQKLFNKGQPSTRLSLFSHRTFDQLLKSWYQEDSITFCRFEHLLCLLPRICWAFFYLLPSPEKLNFLARIRILYMDGRQRTKATKNGWRQPHDTTQPNKTGELSSVRLQSRVVFLSWSVFLLSTMHWWWPAKWRKCGPAKRTKIGYWVS